MRQGVITTGRLINQSLQGFRHDGLFITLTYKDRTSKAYSPKDVSRYLDLLRKWYFKHLPNIKLRYVWVLEDQKDGTPHYHVVVWAPKGVKLPMPDKSGMWSHGHSQIERARNAVAYLAAYASKISKHNSDIFRVTKVLPKGSRIWAFGGLSDVQRCIFRWWRLPSYLRDEYSSADDLRPAAALMPKPKPEPPPENTSRGNIGASIYSNGVCVFQMLPYKCPRIIDKPVRPESLGGFISKTTGKHIPSRYVRVGISDAAKIQCYDWSDRSKVKKAFVFGLVKREEHDEYLKGNYRYDYSAEAATYFD